MCSRCRLPRNFGGEDRRRARFALLGRPVWCDSERREKDGVTSEEPTPLPLCFEISLVPKEARLAYTVVGSGLHVFLFRSDGVVRGCARVLISRGNLTHYGPLRGLATRATGDQAKELFGSRLEMRGSRRQGDKRSRTAFHHAESCNAPRGRQPLGTRASASPDAASPHPLPTPGQLRAACWLR